MKKIAIIPEGFHKIRQFPCRHYIVLSIQFSVASPHDFIKRNKIPMFAAMNRKIYAITLLLSFMVVFAHMMIPHHHHESFEVEFSGPVSHHSNHSHTHNGEHYHSHNEEESENQHEEHSNQNFPQHIHLSSSDDIELVRIKCFWTQDYTQVNQNLISSELFIHTFFEPPGISENAYAFFEIPSNPQFKPQANSLRGPPAMV